MTVSITIQVEVPKEILSIEDVQRELSYIMATKTGPDIKRLFEKTTEGWSGEMNPHSRFGQVNFSIKNYFGVTTFKTTVFTYSKKYAIVNEGSPRHRITPRNGKMLRFRVGYRAATRPRVIGSRAPSRFGDFVSTPIVPDHPGFEAREFDDAIADEYAPTFEKDIQDAIDAAVEANS